jgi:hypothetical protein
MKKWHGVGYGSVKMTENKKQLKKKKKKLKKKKKKEVMK